MSSNRNRGPVATFAAFTSTPPAVSLGQVTAVESHPQWGELATVMLQPSLVPVQTRIARMGVRAAGGAYWPVAVDDEVLVLFPDGDYQHAVAIVGLNSAAALPPASWGNSAPLVVHPSGTTFATTETATTQKVVLEALLPDLAASLTEITGLLAGLGLAAPTTTGTFIPHLATMYRSKGVVSE